METDLEIVAIRPYQSKNDAKDGIVEIDAILSNGETITDVLQVDSQISLEDAWKAVLDWEREILEQYSSEDNYGLLFYACGYDGQEQTRVKQQYAEKGIYVF